MLVTPTKKNRVNLADYDYQRDIENRVLISQLNFQELEILEEILNSSIKFPISSLKETLNLTNTELKQTLEKLGTTGLFSIKNDEVTINKEMRKYYEFQLLKFDNNYRPDMESLQGLLKKVPIQVLPIWYMVPRTSDSIFNSLVDKYFKTPHIYQQYLDELIFDDPILTGHQK